MTATRQQDHVKSRRERGLCAKPGCPVKTGDAYRCAPHGEDHAAECRAARKRARESRPAVAA